MSSCRRQVRHQDKEVKKIAGHDGNRLLDQASEHSLGWTPEVGNMMPNCRFSRLTVRFSVFFRRKGKGEERKATWLNADS